MANEIARQQTPLSEFGGSQQRISTSLNLDDVKQRRKMVSALQDCDYRLTEKIGEQIKVCDYVIHDVEIKGRTDGELIPACRLILVDDKGKTWETVGVTLVRSFQRIAFAEGPPPYKPPLSLWVRTKKKGEISIYWFDLNG